MVAVPRLTGLPVPEAHDTALDGGLLAVEHAPFGPLADRRVTRQQPAPGGVPLHGSAVQVWTGPPPGNPGGGGAGVAPDGPGPAVPGPGRPARATDEE